MPEPLKPRKRKRNLVDSLGNPRHPTWAELSPEERQDRIDRQAERRRRKAETHRASDNSHIPDRYRMLVTGEMTVADLDDEEIFRGQLRNKNGDFRGRPPQWVPQAFVKALQEEQRKRFSSEMQGLVPESMKAIQRVLTKRHPQPGDGAIVNAAFKTIERFAGRVPENVNMNLHAEVSLVEQNMADIIEVDYVQEDKEIEQ